jgi:hypothetical protein
VRLVDAFFGDERHDRLTFQQKGGRMPTNASAFVTLPPLCLGKDDRVPTVSAVVLMMFHLSDFNLRVVLARRVDPRLERRYQCVDAYGL